MLFDSFKEVERIILLAPIYYITLVIMLRISGKRTLSKMNAFDFIITIALGSTLSSVILTKSISILEGMAALFMLIVMQYCVTWLSVRFTLLGVLVKSKPRLIYYNDTLIHEALKNERIREDEIYQAVRNENLFSLAEVHAIVVETDGSLSVIKEANAGKPGYEFKNLTDS
ncbi:hypothetical protein Q75_01460 [Bacillus coahuilensis p1.1.43]|uniref:DUF421 domain-containing protein n=1 Tax=Bacillus coahuilensis p1.1.43 TaxID=1150625 RepID=A0A147KCA2_9BACI|nr:hypothetical protein Q75_01460 [Bacillus coahuilensis p1.1.43]